MWSISRSIATVTVAILLGACGGGGGGDAGTGTGGGGSPVTTYTVGGTVSGLAGSGLVLADNGGDDLSVTTSGQFTFTTKVASGATYNVTVRTQPTNPAQTCAVSNGSGTMSASNVTNVAVACTTNTSSYKVGGSVSGLSGNGLVLQNSGGDDLTITTAGSFSFDESLSSGGAYSVTVLTQPLNQTCAVTNGTGTVGSSDVTSVTVDCVTGPVYSSSSLTGAYTILGYEPLAAEAVIWVVTFDGAGAFTGTATAVSNTGATSNSALSGTYSVAADGSVTVTPAGVAALIGSVGAEGGDSRRLVLAQMTSGQSPSISIGIKRGQGGLANANLKGTYKQVLLNRTALHGALLSITFDGAGHFSYTEVENDSGVISNASDSGTYTVASDGTLTMFITGAGFTFSGALGADGNTVSLVRTTAGLHPTLTVGVKQSKSTFANADLAGTYNAVAFESAGDFGVLSSITADGSGNFTANRMQNHAGTITNTAKSGTYTVDSTGAVTFTVTGGSTASGGVGTDGNTMVRMETTSGLNPSLEFAIK